MTKSEILEVVKRMLADWENAQKFKTAKKVISETNCNEGFCYWLSVNYFDDLKIDQELKKDIDFDLVMKLTLSNFWYETIGFDDDNFKEILQTRIDHLKRTIVRLEKEIETEKLQP